MGKYDELIGSVKMEVSVTEVLDEQAASKVDKQIKKHREKLSEPIKPKLDLSETERGLKKLNAQLESFKKEEERLASEFSKAVAGGDAKEIQKTVKAQQEVEEQLKRITKEREAHNSTLRTYQRELKAARGEERKLSEEEKKVNKLIEQSKTARPPRKPKAKSDSGDAAAAKEEVKANEKLVESVENVSKTKRKAKASKPKTTDTDVVKEEAKANEGLVDAIENVDKVKRKSRAAKPKTSEVETVKEEAQANEQLADAIGEVVKTKRQSKSVKPKINEADAAKQQAKANEELAQSYEKVAGAIERTAEEQKKLDDLNRLASNQKDWIKYLDGALDKEKFASSGKRDATGKLRSATNYLVTQRKESYQNAHGEYAKEMAEVIWMHAYQEAERQGVAQSILSKYDTDAKSNYESNLKTLQEARDYRQERLEDTLKQIQANDALVSSYKQVESAATKAMHAVKESNVVYHAGDLSNPSQTLKSFRLGNVTPTESSRSFNGFTGLYTTEDVDGFWANEWDGAPISTIDLSHYKMFDARSDELATKARTFFDNLNGAIYGYIEYFDYDSGEMKKNLDVKSVEDLYSEFKEVFKSINMDFDTFAKFIKNSKAIVSGNKGFIDVEAPAIDEGIAKSAQNSVLQGVTKDVFDSDSFQTQLLKMLGYEGVDLRGTQFNGTYTGGTVVFDIKPESLKTVNEKWSDVMARNGYEISEESLKYEEKRRQLAFETAKAYSKQAEEQAKGKKSLEEFMALYRELSSKSGNQESFGQRYAYLLEGVSGPNPQMDIGVAYDELIQKEKEYQAAQEEQSRKTAEIARQTQEFIIASNDIMPEGGFAEGSKEIQVYTDLMNQLTKGLITADDAMEQFKQSLDVGNANKSVGQLVLELEQITGKNLIGVLNDYDSLDDGIKEKVNSILKSMGLMNDQLEFTFSRSQGGNAKAVLGQDFVILQKSLEANEDYASDLIKKLQEAQQLGVNIAPIMERVFSGMATESNGFRGGYEIQQRATGSNVHETQKELITLNNALQENQVILGASDEALRKFISDYIKLDEVGLKVDPSKASNFLYDAEKGFSFIDLGLKNANDQAKDLRTIFKEITVVLANTSAFNKLGQDESLGFSSGQIVAKIADSFESAGLATRAEIDSWAKELYDGFGNIFDGYSGKTSEATKWIDELRTKADGLGEEFKDSQQYKDFFDAIENGSINAADSVRKLEEAFNAFGAAQVHASKDVDEAPISQVLSATQIEKAFDAVDLGAYFKLLNIKDEGAIQTLKELYTQFLQLSAAEHKGADVAEQLNDTYIEIVNTIMRFGSVTHEAGEEYKQFYEAMQVQGKPRKLTYNSGQVAEFGDEWKSTKRRFGKYLTPLSSGKGIGVDQVWDELDKIGLFDAKDASTEHSQLKAVLRELGKSMDLKNDGWKISNAISDSGGVERDLAIQSNKMLSAALSTAEGVEKEETALKELEVQATKTANAKKKVTKANKELGAESTSSKDKIDGESDALEDLEENAKNVWTTPRAGGSIEGLNLPTEWEGEKGQDVVQMFAKIKSEIEEVTGSPVKIDFVSEVNKAGELEAIGATLEYINKESGVTVKQFYDIARGEDDVIVATQTAEKATLRATKAQKEFNAQLQQQLAYQQIDTFRKEMGQFAVDLSAVQNAANNITDKNSLDEFNVQLKIARETLKGMKAQMKSQNTLDPIVAAEKRLKSLDSELESLKNKFVFKAGSGVDTKWIDDQIASIKALRKAFDNETDSGKKTGYYKQIIAEIDKAEDGMTNLNELVRLQNKLFKDRRTLSKMDSDTESYKVLEKSVLLQSEELSNLIRNSQHKETIMKRAIQFENELAAATQDRVNKQNQAFEKKYAGVDIISEASWDKAMYADSKEAMQKFATSISDGEVHIKGFNKAGTEMYVTLRNVEGSLDDVTIALDKNIGKMKAFKTGTNGIVEALKSVGKSGLSMVKQVAGMYIGVNDFIRYFQQGVEHVREIDKALTELKKVTDETDESYTKFLKHLSQTAGTIGATVSELTSSAADWARLGYTMEEAGDLAKNTAILMNVSEFDSIADATDTLISALQAYKDEGSDVADLSMDIINKYNEIGNSYAISTSDLAESLTRSSATLVAAGNDLSQSIALTTAANATIQDPNSVGKHILPTLKTAISVKS